MKEHTTPGGILENFVFSSNGPNKYIVIMFVIYVLPSKYRVMSVIYVLYLMEKPSRKFGFKIIMGMCMSQFTTLMTNIRKERKIPINRL